MLACDLPTMFMTLIRSKQDVGSFKEEQTEFSRFLNWRLQSYSYLGVGAIKSVNLPATVPQGRIAERRFLGPLARVFFSPGRERLPSLLLSPWNSQ